MSQIDQAQALELCWKRTECLGCKGTGIDIHYSGQQGIGRPCKSGCKGTGRVPLLDPEIVRVKCPLGGLESHYDPKNHIHPSDPCQGRGWIPSTDPWAYVRAAWPSIVDQQWFVLQAVERALNNISAETGMPDPLDPGPAAFDVVYEALKEKP